MATVYLGLGSNVGDRISYILKAIEKLEEFLEIEKISTVYESKAWGFENQGNFLNFVLKAKTSLLPQELLLKIKKVEKEVGRKERFKWGPREIDIDILLYKDEVIRTKLLKVPHPFLEKRDFFVYPLLEIEPNVIHPIYRKPLKEFKPENTLKPFCCILKV
ncbi:2-amino-4-hydroxy-6-hydroxymethyldihydropteridine diphosphokinase [Aquifex aeolicus]|uniref:2-amino-4-hydroxy-6-hydroxymethyldihydropteridine pyrophosphokinase n=1 Tax=Aquifex aeolicus (strain VF5) TaxID=224324 RepID=HPPK_AQUAE|nr:2-amino-4-hydroxy-6-hydroxymethyldihydropteridine diphosphokinase [Aquifex aeolicus]O66550.1 RecName: Full=2-amino-4-hydroxy-6-hydroxymethyldihydropteridine pyrophosphokinase; AltName: Full=6-hydroxymethyl-7,8-dihydropterin pyrophosphokinase; Short=PPPK; AltName: Full=7,8-dihydro-6-hydroxymethylpterin-pyrophosphokinase; Short=HPPK [Aquifex aeolicus VF5]AAC06507.1 folate biosynthesis 7,8-dihydro-6-hydroxymethylpterin-pyrophosphokinase [Aquifex aeolicus VF5]